MPRVLLYIEPHPIRNYYEEFYDVGKMLSDILTAHAVRRKWDISIFSNDLIIDRLIVESAATSICVIRPEPDEAAKIRDYFGRWDRTAVSNWIDLVNGSGEYTDFYYSVLDRIYQLQPFDVVLVWAENGAVRKFAKDKGLLVIHGEYGPTRAPFHETVYFDTQGTNGNASVRAFDVDKLDTVDSVDPEVWIAAQARSILDENAPGLIDSSLTVNQDVLALELNYPFIYIPLQLIDDTNTIIHSEFDSPEDFLRSVLPTFIEQGYHVVVRGHPGALARPYCMIAEASALAYAASFGDSVKILEGIIPITTVLNVISQASIVCTINSSVGFEAQLMGKRVVLLGDAVYDIGSKLKRSSTDISNLDRQDDDKKYRDKVISFLCRHYFHPKKILTESDALLDIIERAMLAKEIEMSPQKFWNRWIKSFDLGGNFLRDEPYESSSDVEIEAGKISGSIEVATGYRRRLKLRDDDVWLSGNTDHSYFIKHARVENDRFVGYIDEVHAASDAPNVWHVRGWALQRSTRKPPVLLFLIHGETVVSPHRIVADRPDVRDAFDLPGKRIGFAFDSTFINEQNLSDCQLMFLSDENIVQFAKLEVGYLA